jgi:hypothetical protein
MITYPILQSSTKLWRLLLLVLVLLGAAATACTVSYGPQDGTETGNPPAIDASLVALVVQADAVRVTGQPGAVSPGGTALELVSAFSGEVFHATASADGSFSVEVTTAELDTFELRAVRGGAESNTVFVTRGGAAVTPAGSSDSLSCVQQENLARAQLAAVAQRADRSCARDEDCLQVAGGSECNDSCETFLLSSAGRENVEAARSVTEHGLCGSFAEDGCTVTALPCVPRIEVPVCVSGSCQWVSPDAPDSTQCEPRPVCADGTNETWPDVCVRSVTAIPSAGIRSVCVVDADGKMALLALRGDLMVTNEGWTQSGGNGPVRSTLSVEDEQRCQAMLAVWRAVGADGAGVCSPVTP